ncbi:hypothetical protein CGZ80_17750 [Rhodopirellula sp. MGV]|nr:hypothetical protein CGZ80_17750 [Rhodopirellula sp. MGV]PNY37546.1 hypothetical protein C2E31_07395 [Rhodopirellula baltica]
MAALAAVLSSGTALVNQPVFAQNQSILAEVYGRGVHAYYAGDYAGAFDELTAAIDGGSRDPRAYYFRGIVSHLQGRPEQAESDWETGAEIEAMHGGSQYIGRSLSRFQGSARLKLENIRQKARLAALANASQRSDIRMQELNARGNRPAPPVARSTAPSPAPAAPANPKVDNPFLDDAPPANASVQNDDLLKDVVGNPFENDEPAIDAAAPADAGPAAADDPFGAGASGSPFGDSAPAGGDPFGAGAGDDPFGGDPFGN